MHVILLDPSHWSCLNPQRRVLKTSDRQAHGVVQVREAAMCLMDVGKYVLACVCVQATVG